MNQFSKAPWEGGFTEHAKRDSEIQRGVRLEEAQEGHEVGWHPKIDEIPGFIENVIVRTDVSNKSKDDLIFLKKDLDRLGAISGREHRDLEERIINKALEISSKIPKIHIDLSGK